MCCLCCVAPIMDAVDTSLVLHSAGAAQGCAVVDTVECVVHTCWPFAAVTFGQDAAAVSPRLPMHCRVPWLPKHPTPHTWSADAVASQADARIAQAEAAAEARLAETVAGLQKGLEEQCHGSHVAMEKKMGEAAGAPGRGGWQCSGECAGLLQTHGCLAGWMAGLTTVARLSDSCMW